MFFLITPCTSASSALSADMLLLLASGFAYTFFRRWLINLSAQQQQQQQQQHIGWHKGEPKWRGGLLLVNTCVGCLAARTKLDETIRACSSRNGGVETVPRGAAVAAAACVLVR